MSAEGPQEATALSDGPESKQRATKLNPYTEGDAREHRHAKACSTRGGCRMACSCWCHGITKHLSGAERPDANIPHGPESSGR